MIVPQNSNRFCTKRKGGKGPKHNRTKTFQVGRTISERIEPPMARANFKNLIVRFFVLRIHPRIADALHEHNDSHSVRYMSQHSYKDDDVEDFTPARTISSALSKDEPMLSVHMTGAVITD
jgi:hypothetical protein